MVGPDREPSGQWADQCLGTEQPARERSFHRPSDRRGPGSDPGPQCAFEMSMFNVFCNSHYFSHFAAFFIDPRAE